MLNRYQLTGTANRNVAGQVLMSLPDIIGAYLTEGHMVGKIEKDGTVRECMNMLVGKVKSDGEVVDKNNMQTGRVKSDGTVVNRHNMTIGYAKNVPVTYAAVFFFFGFFNHR